MEYKLKTTRKRVEDTSLAVLMNEEDYEVPPEPRSQKLYAKYRAITGKWDQSQQLRMFSEKLFICTNVLLFQINSQKIDSLYSTPPPIWMSLCLL